MHLTSRLCFVTSMLAVAFGSNAAMGQPAGGAAARPADRPAPAETRPGAVAPGDALAALNLFVGDWSGETNKVGIKISAKWDANKKFLRREITLSGGSSSLDGRQEIGWDPISKHIRSWTFSDDGSYTDGLWTLDGNSWIVVATRVLPDGKTTRATQVYRFPDRDTLVWRVIRGSIDGQATGDLEVTLKRTPEK
jgi:hypothetical protein